MSRGPVAYLHYGAQSGVTAQVARALRNRGVAVESVGVTGPLEWRDEQRRLRVTGPALRHLVEAFRLFGRRALSHRWNTPYAFEAHSRCAGEVIDERRAAVVLQNGALFSPGLPPRVPYVLLLDHTRALSMRHEGAVDDGGSWRERERVLYAGAAAIATFSGHVAGSLRDDYGVQGDLIHVVGAGPNLPVAEHPRVDDGRTLVFVGEAFERKGGPVLLEAFSRLRQRHPETKLLVVGPRRRVVVPEGATWLGYVPAEQLPAVFERASLFVLPTLREPFGLAFLDAMARSLPCVGTRVEAVPEIVEDGVTGLLVPPNDVATLAEAMAVLLRDRDRRRAMGAAGRARVIERFGWDRMAARLESLLMRAADPGRRLRPPA